MTNTLIPYSFIPGTKAKASEVNANFIALADEIGNTQTSMAESIESINEDISDGFGSISDRCVSDLLIDNRTVSYAIVSAPNGVMSYADGILTIASGLKTAAPDGKNADDSLKNAEYILEDAITVDMTSYSNGTRHLWLENGGSYFFADVDAYYVLSSEPAVVSAGTIWYNPDTNLLKMYNSGTSSWETKTAVHLGKVTVSGGYITKIEAEKPIHFLTRSDLYELSKMGGISEKFVDLSVLSTGSAYTMQNNGYFVFFGTCTNTGYVQLSDSVRGLSVPSSGFTNFPVGVILPVRKGDVIRIFYANVNISALRFFYKEGNK